MQELAEGNWLGRGGCLSLVLEHTQMWAGVAGNRQIWGLLLDPLYMKQRQ